MARKNNEISDLQFRQTVVNTLANVRQLYYDLIHTIDNLEAQRNSLALANRLLEENRIRVRVGTLAPLDVVAAESEMALREENVIVAEAAVEEAQDALKRAIFPENDPAMWSTRVVPTERPTAEPVSIDSDKAVARALAERTDVGAARRNLESAGYNLEYDLKHVESGWFLRHGLSHKEPINPARTPIAGLFFSDEGQKK